MSVNPAIITATTVTDNIARPHTISDQQEDLLAAKRNANNAFEDIPVIDLSHASSSDISVRKAIGKQIRDACINVGFFYISNHGVPEPSIERTMGAAKRFFALPLEDKMALDIHKSGNFKGYLALLAENTDPKNNGDLHEGFNIGPEPANVWPSQSIAPGFREDMLAYYGASVELGKRLFPLFALALDLPETYFDDKTTSSTAVMRVLHYPPQPVDLEKVVGIGAHADFECFTMLWQNYDVSGLQVLNAAGKWIDAPPIPGTIVINIGDSFARWTNDVFKSTVHRVINQTGAERYSIPVFIGVDHDVQLEVGVGLHLFLMQSHAGVMVLIQAFPTCVSDEYPPKYEVVTAGEYIKANLELIYARSKS